MPVESALQKCPCCGQVVRVSLSPRGHWSINAHKRGRRGYCGGSYLRQPAPAATTKDASDDQPQA